MKADAKKVMALRERIEAVKVEQARLQERREAAIRVQEEARRKLEEFGFDPDNAEEELQEMFDKLVEKVEKLEVAVGITRTSR